MKSPLLSPSISLSSTGPIVTPKPEVETLKSPHTFKLPLQMALGASGVCLFLPTQLMLRDMSRLHLLMVSVVHRFLGEGSLKRIQMWQGLAGPRPLSLLDVDRKIYQALADVALGLCRPDLRLSQLFQGLRDYPWSNVSLSDAEWLKAGSVLSIIFLWHMLMAFLDPSLFSHLRQPLVATSRLDIFLMN